MRGEARGKKYMKTIIAIHSTIIMKYSYTNCILIMFNDMFIVYNCALFTIYYISSIVHVYRHLGH